MESTDVNSWNDAYRDFAKVIGMDATLKVHQEFRGQQINFPMRLVSADAIRMVVQNEYNGANLKELAKDYGYSERHLRRLLTNSDLSKEKSK